MLSLITKDYTDATEEKQAYHTDFNGADWVSQHTNVITTKGRRQNAKKAESETEAIGAW
jgi:hypothetical protein